VKSRWLVWSSIVALLATMADVAAGPASAAAPAKWPVSAYGDVWTIRSGPPIPTYPVLPALPADPVNRPMPPWRTGGPSCSDAVGSEHSASASGSVIAVRLRFVTVNCVKQTTVTNAPLALVEYRPQGVRSRGANSVPPPGDPALLGARRANIWADTTEFCVSWNLTTRPAQPDPSGKAFVNVFAEHAVCFEVKRDEAGAPTISRIDVNDPRVMRRLDRWSWGGGGVECVLCL
jgi:hypothetical protein